MRRARNLSEKDRRRGDPTAAAWDLVAWIEAGASPADWAAHPRALAAVTAEDVAALLHGLSTPVRTLDAVVHPGPAPAADAGSRGGSTR